MEKGSFTPLWKSRDKWLRVQNVSGVIALVSGLLLAVVKWVKIPILLSFVIFLPASWVYVVTAMRLSSWKCPRCHQNYYYWRNPVKYAGDCCTHCGLPNYSPDGKAMDMLEARRAGDDDEPTRYFDG